MTFLDDQSDLSFLEVDPIKPIEGSSYNTNPERFATELPEPGNFHPYLPRAVDSTILTAFDSCFQRGFNEYILRVAPVGNNIHLHAGGCIAHGIEVVRRRIYFHKDDLHTALAHAFVAFMNKWGDYDYFEDHNKSQINSWTAVVDYFNTYPPHDDHIQPVIMNDGQPAVEFTFAIPMEVVHPDTGLPFLYAGRFDLLGKNLKYDGRLVIVDEKTAQSLPKDPAKAASLWRMRGQFYGYVFAAQANGFACSDAVVRQIALQKTDIRHMETPPMLLADWQLSLWWEQANEKVFRIASEYVKMMDYISSRKSVVDHDALHSFWPYSFGDACSSYSGCPYVGLCTSDRPSSWYQDFDRRIWNPLYQNPAQGSETRLSDAVDVSVDSFFT